MNEWTRVIRFSQCFTCQCKSNCCSSSSSWSNNDDDDKFNRKIWSSSTKWFLEQDVRYAMITGNCPESLQSIIRTNVRTHQPRRNYLLRVGLYPTLCEFLCDRSPDSYYRRPSGLALREFIRTHAPQTSKARKKRFRMGAQRTERNPSALFAAIHGKTSRRRHDCRTKTNVSSSNSGSEEEEEEPCAMSGFVRFCLCVCVRACLGHFSPLPVYLFIVCCVCVWLD